MGILLRLARIASVMLLCGALVYSWQSVFPQPLRYCPVSPLPYDCQYFQQNVWNVPSLANPPITLPSEDSSLLVVFLPGTGSTPQQFRDGLLASWHAYGKAYVLGQSYVGTPYPVSDMNMLCGDDRYNGGDSVAICLSRFHNAVAYGDEQYSSPLWDGLNSADAIEMRILNSLETLHQDDSSKGWNRFFTPSAGHVPSLNWERIIISGHSQGAGHAAYIGYSKHTAQVVMLSGPQDCCSYSSFTNTPWRTPLINISALYHLHEDARGSISRNLDQISQSVQPVEFSLPFSPSSLSQSSRIYYSTLTPQVGCPCTTRQEHCSTASDACSPFYQKNEVNSTVLFAYRQLWQYLAFGSFV